MPAVITSLILIVALLGCGRPAPTTGKLQHPVEVDFIPGGVPPEFCKDAAYRNEPACFATAPEYCKDQYYNTSPSCLLAAPEYCKENYYGESPACFSSAPGYCEDSYYSKVGACRGTLPNYCNDAAYRNEPACIRLSETKLTYFCRRMDTRNLCPEEYRSPTPAN